MEQNCGINMENFTLNTMLNRLHIDLIVEIGILAGPDEYEQIAKTSKRNANILQKPYIIKATNAFIVKSWEFWFSNEHYHYQSFKYNGILHSFNDNPAVIHNDGTKLWYQHGNLHRNNDQPAIVKDIGSKEWYQHGKLHRDNDQPAVIQVDGFKGWYQHGKRIK
jgi:hypothetical protein